MPKHFRLRCKQSVRNAGCVEDSVDAADAIPKFARGQTDWKSLTREQQDARNVARRGKRTAETTKRTLNRINATRRTNETPLRPRRSKKDKQLISLLASAVVEAQGKFVAQEFESALAEAVLDQLLVQGIERLKETPKDKDDSQESEQQLLQEEVGRSKDTLKDKDEEIGTLDEANETAKNNNTLMVAKMMQMQGMKVNNDDLTQSLFGESTLEIKSQVN